MGSKVEWRGGEGRGGGMRKERGGEGRRGEERRELVMFASSFLANLDSKNDSFSACQFYPVEALDTTALKSCLY